MIRVQVKGNFLKWAGVMLAGTVLLGGPRPAWARSDEERRIGGRVVAKQPRLQRRYHEFSVGGGILPLDALYTGFSLGGSYTLHLSDVFALELVDFRYSANVDSGLESQLEERFDVVPTTTPEVEYIAGSGFLITPLYGKLAVIDQAVIAASTHLGLSVGVANFSDGFRFQATGGPGFRIMFGDVISTRFDLRGTVAFDGLLGTESLLQINLGLGFHVGDRERPQEEAQAKEIDPDEVLDALYPNSRPDPQAEETTEEEDTL